MKMKFIKRHWLRILLEFIIIVSIAVSDAYAVSTTLYRFISNLCTIFYSVVGTYQLCALYYNENRNKKK